MLAAQAFEFAALMGLGCQPGMQAEASHLAHGITELILRLAGGQRLQGEYPAPCLRSHGDEVRDRSCYIPVLRRIRISLHIMRIPQQRIHRVVIHYGRTTGSV